MCDVTHTRFNTPKGISNNGFMESITNRVYTLTPSYDPLLVKRIVNTSQRDGEKEKASN
jgi:hypothetical protein